MKKSILSIALSATLVTSALVSTQASAEVAGIEGLSANVGLVSQYFFRGIEQVSTATASAGVDYENNGFYTGVWTADVEDGLEIDYYAGYGFEFDNGLSLSAGYALYLYTGGFDTEYNEFNFNASYSFVSVEYSVGTWEDGVASGQDLDYDFLAITLAQNGFYGTYGTFGDELEGDYIEVGYNTSIGGFDTGVSLIKSDDDLTGGASGSSFVLSLSKSF